MNILYLDDYINYYSKKNSQIIKVIPYKNSIRNGVIIDKVKFIKRFNKLLIDNHIKNSLLSDSITVIINNYYTEEDKYVLKEILNEMNYKNVYFTSENKYLNIKKDIIYINCNYTYFYILHLNYLGNLEINLYKNDDLNKKILKYIIKNLKPNTIILYGKNTFEIKEILDDNDIDNYYYFEENDNLIINIMLNEKFV